MRDRFDPSLNDQPNAVSEAGWRWLALHWGMLVVLLWGRPMLADEPRPAWQTASSPSQGLSVERLDAMRDALADRNTKSLVIVRHGRLVHEWYAPEFSADKPHYTASLAKAIVGGMSLALAMEDGRIALDEPAAKYIPQWRNDSRKSKITIRHLATHTSGIEDAEEANLPHNRLPGWKGAFWKRNPDPFTISRDLAPVVFEPGERMAYSNPGMAMLAYAVTASLRGTRHDDIRSLLRERIMRPLGIHDREWSIGYGTTYRVDDLKLVANWGGGAITPRAAARIGQMLLRRGQWQAKRLLSPGTVDEMTLYSPTVPSPPLQADDPAPAPALGWWSNMKGVWKALPRDAFCGAGAGHQILLVIPSLELVVVRNGGNLARAKDETFWAAAERHLFNPLMKSVVEPPYRPSSVIRRIEFKPVSSITRKAIGSDNWPITWADDGHLYTSYGDGWGFEPRINQKLSMGFCRIEGMPDQFRGINIRSKSGERVGDGARGPKASGLLCIGGRLYMWVRNTGNATLAWSDDHAASWTWSFTFNESFGCPTFLNIGQDYAGAPDGYIYTYSPDGNSAYEPADGIVLARVKVDRVTERQAYEFFAGIDDEGQAQWSRDIARKHPVFAYAGHCERLDVVYNAGLKRYLMTVSFGHGKGWGIFDAPHPWGPWTTALYAPQWDVPETHGYRLPSKWISEDGRRMWLVFSGVGQYDAFCVRGLTLQIYDQ